MWRTERKLHLRKYPFNADVSEGTRAGVTEISGSKWPTQEDQEKD